MIDPAPMMVMLRRVLARARLEHHADDLRLVEYGDGGIVVSVPRPCWEIVDDALRRHGWPVGREVREVPLQLVETWEERAYHRPASDTS